MIQGRYNLQMAGVVLVMVGMLLSVMIACTTLSIPGATKPAACEDSMIWKHKTTVDVTLSAVIVGVHVMANYNPDAYQMAQQSAKQAVALLSGGPVSFAEFQGVPGWVSVIAAPLLSIFSPDKVLGECDRKILIGYLEMV
jgi:hypothetical protein